MIVNGVEIMDIIKIENAYENNLKHIYLDIPINKWTCFIGPSGSGKSSLVYDTLFAECQREFLDSLVSNQYGQRLLEKAKVDNIINLKPALDLSQNYYNTNPRSTVGTFTDISYYLRTLYSLYVYLEYKVMVDPSYFSPNNAKSVCSKCKGTGTEYCVDLNKLIPDRSVKLIRGGITFFSGGKDSLAIKKLEALCEYYKIDITKTIDELSASELDKLLYGNIKYPIEIIYKTPKGRRKKESILLKGAMEELSVLLKDIRTPSTFISIEKYLGETECSSCSGSGLNEDILNYTINGLNIYDYESLPVYILKKYLIKLETQISKNTLIAQIKNLTKTITDKIDGLIDLKIGYLSLSRKIPTLSGGECQRVRLSKQLGSSLTGLLYILDEPCKGLHYKDINSIIKATRSLVEKGNTVVSIEHNSPYILSADKVIEMGPCGGPQGGFVIDEGRMVGLCDKKNYSLPASQLDECEYIDIKKINKFNLVDIDIQLPVGCITAITGQSGVGKSTLANVIYDYVSKKLYKKSFKHAYIVNQKPIGKNSRSTLISYLGIYEHIRNVLADTDLAKKNKVKPVDFSMNSGHGRCETCNGVGRIKLDLPYMENVFCKCPTCDGKRFNENVLKVRYNGKNISDILDESISEIKDIFKEHLSVFKMLEFLVEIGLGYLKLGQLTMTLSGGEAQRIKIAKFLANRQNNSLFILDEPTAGLYSSDKVLVMNMIKQLCSKGNTCIIIEHDFNVICNLSNYMIDMITDDQNYVKVIYGPIDKVVSNPLSSWYDLFLSDIT